MLDGAVGSFWGDPRDSELGRMPLFTSCVTLGELFFVLSQPISAFKKYNLHCRLSVKIERVNLCATLYL